VRALLLCTSRCVRVHVCVRVRVRVCVCEWMCVCMYVCGLFSSVQQCGADAGSCSPPPDSCVCVCVRVYMCRWVGGLVDVWVGGWHGHSLVWHDTDICMTWLIACVTRLITRVTGFNQSHSRSPSPRTISEFVHLCFVVFHFEFLCILYQHISLIAVIRPSKCRHGSCLSPTPRRAYPQRLLLLALPLVPQAQYLADVKISVKILQHRKYCPRIKKSHSGGTPTASKSNF